MPGSRPTFVNQLARNVVSASIGRSDSRSFSSASSCLALVGSVVYFMNRVEYEALYRDLNPEDAQAIAAKLKEEKKDFIVQGTSILVAAPKTEIDKLRLEIAGSGLARSGRVGYEIFDKNQFGMTDFTEQVNLQRALEGELARTISSLSEISQARVHIVLPKDSIFEDKKEEAKASVVVRLKNGSGALQVQHRGDQGRGGRSRSRACTPTTFRLWMMRAGFFLNPRNRGMQARSRNGIRHPGAAREGNGRQGGFDSRAAGRKRRKCTPMPRSIWTSTPPSRPKRPTIRIRRRSLSQQKSEERVGSAAAASGVPGTQSNVAGATAQQPGPAPERLRQSEITNYEVNKLVRHTVQPKGTVRRLSVAVILDHKTSLDSKDAMER